MTFFIWNKSGLYSFLKDRTLILYYTNVYYFYRHETGFPIKIGDNGRMPGKLERYVNDLIEPSKI